jgi:hypothetical protein
MAGLLTGWKRSVMNNITGNQAGQSPGPSQRLRLPPVCPGHRSGVHKPQEPSLSSD